MLVYELSDCGVESSCGHLNFRHRACFEQGVPWHSGNYRVWIHSETRTWHDKNIQPLVLESLSNKVAGLQVFSCENWETFKSRFFYRTPLVAASADVLLYIIFSKRHCWIYCSYTLRSCFILKPKINLIRFHSLSFVVPVVVIRCTTHRHSLSLVLIRCHSLYHSLSLDVPLVCFFINDLTSLAFSRLYTWLTGSSTRNVR